MTPDEQRIHEMIGTKAGTRRDELVELEAIISSDFSKVAPFSSPVSS